MKKSLMFWDVLVFAVLMGTNRLTQCTHAYDEVDKHIYDLSHLFFYS